MVRVAVVSDTHIPDRETTIPAAFRERIAAADRAVHAGDFTNQPVLEEVRDLAAGELVAAAGNMDPGTLGLSTVETFSVGGVSFVVTHGSGPLDGYEDRVVRTVREAGGEVGIAGHTHEPLDRAVDGVRLLNPGSCTGAPPATEPTMLTLEVGDGAVDATLHRA